MREAAKRVAERFLGWEAETTSEEIVGGMTVTRMSKMGDPDVSAVAVTDPTGKVAIVREDDGDEYVITPLDGPTSFDMTMTVRIIDDERWEEVFENGASEATAAIFGDQNPEESGISWGDISLSTYAPSKTLRVTLPVSVTDERKAASFVRESRAAIWGDEWVPGSLRELAFEAAVGSSDAPGPDDNGYEIIDDSFWKGADATRDLIEAGVKGAEGFSPHIEEMSEDGSIKSYGSAAGWRSDITIVSKDGSVTTFDLNAMRAVMPDQTPEDDVSPS